MKTLSTNLLLAALLHVLPASALAADASIVSEVARKAITKGYGTTCSLEMKPVERGGYFPCIDMGPYRVVFEYTAVKGFVIQKDLPPFLIMNGPPENPPFVVDGPWTTDMPARVIMWWNDEIEGQKKRLDQTRRTSSEKKAAEDYVNKLMGKTEPPATSPTQIAPSPPRAAPAPTGEGEIGEDIRQILQH